ncbi:MAG TPA: tripartite tricarboxylate transporter substrate binding protein [Burkholderiaceae bacterium]|nr:tripartite tricarboxylate transporter substrate binding protein [Burkholderiaceae bacterium]
MKLKRLIAALGVTTLTALAVQPALAQAQNYPKGPVKMIVPFPPGSATDLAARVIGQQLQTALGKPFVVENKPGAQGTIAGSEVVRAAPDGQTLLFTSNTAIASNVPLMKKMPYDPTKDFAPVAGIGTTALVLMVKPDFPAKNLNEFIAHAKARPGKLAAGYGSTSSQISISRLSKMSGLDVLSVPYKGIPLAVNDVLSGQVQFTFVDLGNAMAQAKGGTLRPIAITAPQRNPLAPDLPTLAEVLPGYDITAWFAIVAPAGTPKSIVDKLHAATTKALASAEVKDRLATIGIAPMPMTPEELSRFIVSEVGKWTRLTKEAGIEPE